MFVEENLHYCQIALIIQVQNPERNMHLITRVYGSLCSLTLQTTVREAQ